MISIPPGHRHNLLLALCCLPAIIIIIAVGFYLNKQAPAMLIASGALSLAFGANKTWRDSSFVVLFTTALGLMAASFLGSLAGNFPLLYLAGALLATGLYIVILDINANLGWIFLQSAIAFMVSGFFPGKLEAATTRATLLGCGCILQIFSLGLFFSGLRFNFREVTSLRKIKFYEGVKQLNQQYIHLRWSIFFGVIAMCLTITLDHHFNIQHSYWAEMTLLICLRSDYHESLLRVPARIIGTLVGVLAAGTLSTYLHDDLLIILAFFLSAGIAIFMSYSLTSKTYAFFAFFITMMIIFMLSGIGLVQGNIGVQRLEATTLGGIFALLTVFMTRLVTYIHIKKPEPSV